MVRNESDLLCRGMRPEGVAAVGGVEELGPTCLETQIAPVYSHDFLTHRSQRPSLRSSCDDDQTRS